MVKMLHTSKTRGDIPTSVDDTDVDDMVRLIRYEPLDNFFTRHPSLDDYKEMLSSSSQSEICAENMKDVSGDDVDAEDEECCKETEDEAEDEVFHTENVSTTCTQLPSSVQWTLCFQFEKGNQGAKFPAGWKPIVCTSVLHVNLSLSQRLSFLSRELLSLKFLTSLCRKVWQLDVVFWSGLKGDERIYFSSNTNDFRIIRNCFLCHKFALASDRHICGHFFRPFIFSKNFWVVSTWKEFDKCYFFWFELEAITGLFWILSPGS